MRFKKSVKKKFQLFLFDFFGYMNIILYKHANR